MSSNELYNKCVKKPALVKRYNPSCHLFMPKQVLDHLPLQSIKEKVIVPYLISDDIASVHEVSSTNAGDLISQTMSIVRDEKTTCFDIDMNDGLDNLDRHVGGLTPIKNKENDENEKESIKEEPCFDPLIFLV